MENFKLVTNVETVNPAAVPKVSGGGITIKVENSPEKTKNKKNYDKDAPLTPEQSKLVKDGYEWARSVAYQVFSSAPNPYFDLNDYIGWATEGLIEAAKRFDGLNGYDFKTYSSYIIKGRIVDNIRRQSILSRRYVDFIKARKKALEEFSTDKEPSDADIAEKMGLTVKKYLKMMKKVPLNSGFISIDAADSSHVEDGSNENTILDNFILQLNPFKVGTSEQDKRDETRELLSTFLVKLKLSERDRQIFEMYFNQNIKLNKIAEQFNMTESRISQIKNKIVDDLRVFFQRIGYHVPQK